VPGPRRTSVFFPVDAGLWNVTELPLPMIEGQVIMPVQVEWIVNANPADEYVMMLSHERERLVPTTAPWEDPSMWLKFYKQVAGPLDPYQTRDLRGFDFELAGPQSIVTFNGDSGTVNFYVSMWYNVKNVSLIEWAALAQQTSFES